MLMIQLNSHKKWTVYWNSIKLYHLSFFWWNDAKILLVFGSALLCCSVCLLLTRAMANILWSGSYMICVLFFSWFLFSPNKKWRGKRHQIVWNLLLKCPNFFLLYVNKTAYTPKSKSASRCYRRTFLSKCFHKEPLISEEPFTKGYLWRKMALHI